MNDARVGSICMDRHLLAVQSELPASVFISGFWHA